MERISSLLTKICNLRTFVVVIAIWLIAGATLPAWFVKSSEGFNQTIFQAGLYFSELPPPRTPITVIHVPDLEYERWMVDLPGAGRLLQLLERLDNENIKDQSRVLGLVLEYPIALIQPEVESVLAEIQQGRTTDQHFYQEAAAVLARRAELLKKLSSRRVVLGVENHRPSRFRTMPVRFGEIGQYPQMVVDWLWPTQQQSSISAVNPVLDYFPILTSESSSQSHSLALKQQNNYIPSFWAQFILSSKRSFKPIEETSNTMLWQRDKGFLLGEQYLNASPSGAVVPIYGRLSGVETSLRQISLSASLTRDDLSGWILIGRNSSEQLSQAAQILASLGDGAVMVEPIWWSPIHKSLLGISALFLLLVVPLVSKRRAFWGVVFICTSVAALQIVGQSLRGFWLPAGTLLIFVLGGYGAMIVWLVNHRYQQLMVNRADAAEFKLASHLLSNKPQDEKAISEPFELLKNCRTTEYVLKALYELGLSLEEASCQQQALLVFREIRRRKWRYLDVNTKLKSIRLSLSNMACDESTQVETQAKESPPLLLTKSEDNEAHTFDQTHALPNMLSNKTAFGRYEIERELGRGASGTVYLGFDPLISRQVAIKTLNYHQFSEAEIEEVKSRFEREAEAAGSLSHPNIVPVFDVGEESGAAYIAMDFAKGSPLSEFVSEETLLPVFEVYRIALAIAEALEYAHNNKIVHRDIKPGNVLFCRESFQVKITDFGIARFIDNSQTRTGEILGSPLYMAPEQLLGKKVSFSADIFSLGVMFYQLLTGVLPFNGDSLASLTYDIVHNKHKGARSVRKSLPASATRITNVALQKKAGERYPSASAMAEALRKAIKRDFASEAKSSGCF